MIEVEARKDGLWTLRLNRPDKANALTADMLGQLIAAVRQASAARALIVTGVGKVFSAGADLDEARAGLATSPLWEDLSSALAALPCLKIAALNGTLAGGANGMALACDLRIAVPTAKVFYPVMRLGYMPQPSDVVRMRALIGPARTKMVLAAGQKLTAQEAYDFGLIDRIVEPDALLREAETLAEPALGADPDLAARILAACDGL
ncbi:putative enoyl-CoA hydratase echA6 [Tritonibacter multivorans]|uniref:Putative enoyl-CoA hydratase echA6 n=1 Tax=Tritonibacter multivorans TaxID=928856 RepID=A0A0P1GD80_9RHOB|nr:enoyl-CoA hydratase/isomerase family protein [Tritonibacter multivorans]MDA7419936.1 enoyl-CoA hydratase/isomerase family protein [Tritonibacter multivorans]CUH79355.1 putative enoyl-CoA hydratase echA6 [Tritonibacter multivorans]SFC11131.1 Enoyl-CoA hydratase/carnithine racemase [Tritonibacter multivorans]